MPPPEPPPAPTDGVAATTVTTSDSAPTFIVSRNGGGSEPATVIAISVVWNPASCIRTRYSPAPTPVNLHPPAESDTTVFNTVVLCRSSTVTPGSARPAGSTTDPLTAKPVEGDCAVVKRQNARRVARTRMPDPF